jgi:pimeloyl-ACP methyl ester carboxylesterase
MPKAKVEGVSLHYQQMGQGRDLVLIHWLFSNLAFWYFSVLPALARDFRVTVYDLRGHGYSETTPNGYTSADMAADLHALLNHLGIGSAHIVGHSFGGAVALHYAVLYPERVDSRTLADAQVPGLQPALPPRSAARLRLLKRKLQRAGIEVPDEIPRVAYTFLDDLARLQRWRQRGGPRSPGAGALLRGWESNSQLAKNWFRLVRTTSAPAELSDPAGLTAERIRQQTQPTMAIFGEYSSCQMTLARLEECLPNCKKVIVPRVGHFHPILKPKTFVSQLRLFIWDLGAGERAVS